MIALSRDDLRALVAEARLAPSVHNVQPSRWRAAGNRIELLGDPSRSVPVADPTWRDWYLSHGAALEGFDLALAQRRLRLGEIEVEPAAALSPGGPLVGIARASIIESAGPKPDAAGHTRVSWRGSFLPADDETRLGLDRLAAEHEDLLLVRDRPAIADAAVLADRAGLQFLREAAHRRELCYWLRLQRSHPDLERDGLSARAMNMGAIEAWGAGLVLGPLFAALDRVGIAAPLVSEAAKTRTTAAVVLFHRPVGESAFVSGRAFYRAWLSMERLGLKGCPMSVLADWAVARDALAAAHGIAQDRQIVSAFRIGKPDRSPAVTHARLPVDELIV